MQIHNVDICSVNIPWGGRRQRREKPWKRCARYSAEQDPVSNKTDGKNWHLRMSWLPHTHCDMHKHIYTHVLRHTNMHSCINMHSHTQKWKKNHNTAFKTKTATPNSFFASSFHSSALLQTLSFSISIHWSLWLQTHLVSILCHNVLLHSAPHPPHPSTPISVLARRASAKWVSSVKSGDFLHKQLQLLRCPGTYLSGISLHRYFLNLLSDLSLTLKRAFHTQQQSAWRKEGSLLWGNHVV